MLDPDSPNVLDRQVRNFQFRIQQVLTLRDEEIERLASHLNGVKTKIVESREKIDELSREIDEAEEHRDGDMRRQQASSNAVIAKVKASQNAAIRDLRNQNTAEIDELQRNFEDEIDRVSSVSTERRDGAVTTVEEEIRKMRRQTQTYRESAAQLRDQNENADGGVMDDVQLVDHGVIDELQNIIDQRNAERFENLQQAKEKLRNCVEKLDQMMRSHMVDVNDRRKRIRDIDARYETDLKNIEEMHRDKRRQLTENLDEAEKRTHTLVRAAHYLEHTNQKQLKNTMRELDVMKQKTLVNTDRKMATEEDAMKVEELTRDLEKARRVMSVKDDQLLRSRSVNERLKSEIWRIRHHLKFNNAPRSVLNI